MNLPILSINWLGWQEFSHIHRIKRPHTSHLVYYIVDYYNWYTGDAVSAIILLIRCVGQE